MPSSTARRRAIYEFASRRRAVGPCSRYPTTASGWTPRCATTSSTSSRASKAWRDRAGGLGLGLAVVRQLVELHGGTASAFSEGEGKGSRFFIDLPGAPPASVLVSSTSQVVPRSAPLRIVLIEDDEDGRIALEEALSDLDHHVEVASNGVTGLALVLKSRPDVAIVDIGLPELDGYEVARRIRARYEGPGLRLIAMSGTASRRTGSAESAGFDVHIVEPISIGDLQRTLVGEG